MVRSAGVFSDGGDGDTRDHHIAPSGIRESGAPPSPEIVSPSSESCSGAVCMGGDPLCNIPTKTTPESSPSGERLRQPKWSVVNSRLPK
jgi:hypothetical protein